MNTSLPTLRNSLHYPQGPHLLLEDFAAQGPLHVHLRTRSSALESIFSLGSPIDDEDEGILYFPECGLNLRTSLLQTAHASQLETKEHEELCLEMDFLSAPNGVSITTHSSCDREAFRRVLLHHPYNIVPREELEQQRLIDSPSPCMCHRCAAIAKARREAPEKHPMTSILRHAKNENIPLLCRLDASHAGLSRWLVPEQIQIRHGIISASDPVDQTALHLNLGFAHSLWVLQTKIDGDPFSLLRVYDSLGQMSMEIATPDPKIAWFWEQVCETAEPFADEI